MGQKLQSKAKPNPMRVRESYVQHMEKDLARSGVTLFEPSNGTLDINSDYLTLSAELTDIPSKELGEHLNAFTQQKMYMRTLVGRMEIFVEEAKRKYMEVSTQYYKELPPKLAESAKERLVVQEPDVKPLYEEYIDLTKKLSIVKMQVENIEDAIFLLSREVTRRTGDFSDENRAYNVGRR